MRVMFWAAMVLGVVGGLFHLWPDKQEPMHPDDPRQRTGEAGIVMLAAEWCGYCRKQQADFERAQVRYRVMDVDTDEGARAAQALGTRGVPVTVVGQDIIHGYDTGRLDSALTPLGYQVY